MFFPEDLVGGTLKHFGGWIKEPDIHSVHRFPHTRYWRVDEPACEELKKVLDLDAWWTRDNNAEIALGAQALESEALTKRTHD